MASWFDYFRSPVGRIAAAARRGDYETVSRMLDEDPRLSNAIYRSGGVLLHYAAQYGDLQLAELLLDHGAAHDARDKAGKPPLHHAVVSTCKQMVTLLLAKGADPNARDKAGDTPLHRAIIGPRNQIVTLLLAGGADPNAMDSRGYCPLHWAALMYSHISSSSELAQFFGNRAHDEIPSEIEADISADLVYPLSETAELLLANRADVDVKNRDGATPLHMAILEPGLTFVELLLRHDADVNAKMEGGLNSLHVATVQGNLELVELLLRYDADVTAKTPGGATPLSVAMGITGSRDFPHAALYKHQIADLLCRHGATE